MDCKVKGCNNNTTQGMFMEALCTPCYTYARGLVTGDMQLVVSSIYLLPEVKCYIDLYAEDLLKQGEIIE